MPTDTKSSDMKADSKKAGTQNFSVRLTDDDQARLEKAAEIFRRQTGSKETASGLARTFIQIGLNQFESTGGLVVSS